MTPMDTALEALWEHASPACRERLARTVLAVSVVVPHDEILIRRAVDFCTRDLRDVEPQGGTEGGHPC